MQPTEYVFWGSLALIGYVSVIYPLIVWLAGLVFSGRDVRGAALKNLAPNSTADVPTVSLIIETENSENVILDRLQNATLLEYPAESLEILVGCRDGNDLTADLVRMFGDAQVHAVRTNRHLSQAALVNECARRATGEILVLTDARVMLAGESIARLVRHFANPKVGAVCGRLEQVDGLTGQLSVGMAPCFENLLKRWEGRLGAVPVATSELFALRRELFEPISEEFDPLGLFLAEGIHRQGSQVRYDETALAVEELRATHAWNLRRSLWAWKHPVRMLRWLAPSLNPLTGLMAIVYWTRVVLRSLCPLLLVVALIANVGISSDLFYLRMLVCHEALYLLAVLMLLYRQRVGKSRLCGRDARWRELTETLSGNYKKSCRGEKRDGVSAPEMARAELGENLHHIPDETSWIEST